jgi:hypothetical protein
MLYVYFCIYLLSVLFHFFILLLFVFLIVTQAHCVSVLKNAQSNIYDILIFDTTLFYPTSGGQDYDTGTVVIEFPEVGKMIPFLCLSLSY